MQCSQAFANVSISSRQSSYWRRAWDEVEVLATGAAGRVRVDATAGGSSNSDNDIHGPLSKKRDAQAPGDADVPQGLLNRKAR